MKLHIKQVLNQRAQEQETLCKLAAITSFEFAEQAAEILDPKKHSYSFTTYLVLLENLVKVIDAGMPNCLALELVQTGYSAEVILSFWRLFQEEGELRSDKERIGDVSNVQKKKRKTKE